MTVEKRKVELRVLSTLIVEDTCMIVGKLISGDIYGGGSSLAYFTCAETGGRWKLAAIGLPTIKELDDDVRSIGFEHVDGSNHLEKGFKLISD